MKSIRISESVYTKLKERGSMGDSFNSVIESLLKTRK